MANRDEKTKLYTIETATWRDLNSLRQLENVCFPKDSWPLLDLIGVLTYPNIVRLKAVSSSRMIGFIAGDHREKNELGWIATIGVLPEYRRLGIASALLLQCEALLGTPRIRLNVRRSNQEAIELYRKLGYYTVSTWQGYYHDGEDALIFEKVITA